MNNQSSVSVSLKKDDFSIPVLDMNEWFHGSEEDKALFSSKWDAAFASSGFCSIVNHGVPRAVIDYAYNATRDFFDQPMSEKLKYRAKEFCGPGFREAGEENFTSYKSEAGDTDGKTTYDLNDCFHFSGTETSADHFIPSALESPQELHKAVSEYWPYLNDLLSTIHEISDAALGMPRGTFHQWYKSGGTPVVQLRMSDYFVLTDQDKNIHGGMRIGAHTDPCGFTILWSNGPPGLEVAVGEVDFNSTILTPLFDHWVPIQTNPDALIINAGDFYRFWTNGHWKSSYHRVIPLPERRISMVYFTSPGYSARSDNVLPSAVTAGEFKFPSITIADKLEHSRQVAEVFKSENSMLL